MRCKFILLLLLCSLSVFVFAGQKDGIVVVEGNYLYPSDNPNETPAQAKQKAIDRAIDNALEEAFGRDVSSVNSTFTKNSSDGESVNTETKFYSMGFSSVKGKWIETLKQEVDGPISVGDGFLYYNAHVKGKARAKKVTDIMIESTILRNGTDDINASDVFYSGDDLYISFKTPVEGYVCVYIVDEDGIAYCMLPYQYNPTGYQKVNANVEYTFFSEKYVGPNEQIDTYKLVTNRSAELNNIWIIFSPNLFYKANDNSSAKNWLGEPVPRSLTYEKLEKWLGEVRSTDEQMIVNRYPIMIRRK